MLDDEAVNTAGRPFKANKDMCGCFKTPAVFISLKQNRVTRIKITCKGCLP